MYNGNRLGLWPAAPSVVYGDEAYAMKQGFYVTDRDLASLAIGAGVAYFIMKLF